MFLIHTLAAPGGAEQVARAIARGARCRVDPLVGLDYFAIADLPLAKVRADWGLLD